MNRVFGTNFVISSHPDGEGSLLKINKEVDVRKFLALLIPHTKNLISMTYKFDIDSNLKMKHTKIRNRYGDNVHIKISSSNRNKPYSNKDISMVVKLKKLGATDQDIANSLSRSYWSVVYKIRELRKKGLL